MSLLHFQLLSAALLSIGIYGVLARRNAVLILLSLELMLNAVNVNLVAFSSFGSFSASTGQVIAIFVITVAAAEAAVALALAVSVYRSRQTVEVDQLDLLRL